MLFLRKIYDFPKKFELPKFILLVKINWLVLFCGFQDGKKFAEIRTGSLSHLVALPLDYVLSAMPWSLLLQHGLAHRLTDRRATPLQISVSIAQGSFLQKLHNDTLRLVIRQLFLLPYCCKEWLKNLCCHLWLCLSHYITTTYFHISMTCLRSNYL